MLSQEKMAMLNIRPYRSDRRDCTKGRGLLPPGADRQIAVCPSGHFEIFHNHLFFHVPIISFLSQYVHPWWIFLA